MPTVILYGHHKVRCRPMLNVIGAQESLEFYLSTDREVRAKLAGPSAVALFERDRITYARKRNTAERALNDDELGAFRAWRHDDKAGREAVRAMLIDPPRKGVST